MKPTFIFQNQPVFQDGLVWRISTHRWEMLYMLSDYLTAEGFDWDTVTYSQGVESGSIHKI